MGNSADVRVAKAKRTMTGIGRFIKELHVSLSSKEGPVTQVNNFLPLVFESCQNLKKLTLSGGELTEAVYKKVIRQRLISDLTLPRCLIDTAAFPRLSFLFAHLDSFRLSECVYRYLGCTKNDVRITMPSTIINVMTIANQGTSIHGARKSASDDEFASNSRYYQLQQQRDEHVVFVAIEFSDTYNTQKYYTSDSTIERGKVVEIKKKDYFRLLNKSRRGPGDQLSVIQLKVKSLKTLCILTPKHHVRLTF